MGYVLAWMASIIDCMALAALIIIDLGADSAPIPRADETITTIVYIN